MVNKRRKKVDVYKGIKLPKTPIERLPKHRRDELRKAMLQFIRDTHQDLATINPEVLTMGAEASLESLEDLHEQGYLVFERDQNECRYGHRIMLYDDETGVYDDMTNTYELLQKKHEREADDNEYWPD